ncbi:MAG: hypothetical protein J2P19_29290, partial [Pseudonocardia sp.]|nr:hypothetical protein [Pseudonocardia sp.]
ELVCQDNSLNVEARPSQARGERPHPGHARVLARRRRQVRVAFVVCRPGRSLTQHGVASHCRRHLAGFKVPKAVFSVDQPPRTASGKVRKHRLRRAVARNRGDTTRTPSDDQE